MTDQHTGTLVAEDMQRIAGGEYGIGSDQHYPEERPACRVKVNGFLIDRFPVSNRDFAAFVAATGWVTVAERQQPAGSAVFRMSPGPVDLHNPAHWWQFVAGAYWREPLGPGSSLQGLDDHPVTHIALEDAQAYARWRKARLPTDIEWEVAARGGIEGASYAWGDSFMPEGKLMANVWTGMFPWYFAREAVPGTSRLGSFAANGYGLFDMIGNVWEWTTSPWQSAARCSSCGDTASGSARLFTLKGGSFLCAGEYCARYRPAARIALTAESSAQHIGFRCVRDIPTE